MSLLGTHLLWKRIGRERSSFNSEDDEPLRKRKEVWLEMRNMALLNSEGNARHVTDK